MGFYLRIIEMFYKPREAMVSIFGGGKVIYVGVVVLL
jgi:hypothetical protein